MGSLMDFLLKSGWRKDERSLQLVSPDERRVPLEQIANMDPAFRKVAMDFNKLQEIMKAPELRPGRKWTAYEKLKMRLDLRDGDSFGLDYCHIFESANKTFVFVIKGDKALILEDHPTLFPSDTMVAQFRLFQQATA